MESGCKMVELTQYRDNKLKDIKYLIDSIILEHMRQIDKWGVQEHSLFEWCNYTTEEVGELAKAIAEKEYRNGTFEDIFNEAIQVATLSLKIANMVFQKSEEYALVSEDIDMKE